MVHEIINRTLWYEAQDGRTELPQGNLAERSEPLVILGEAGMGKSHLLEWLATSPGYALCTARQLINRYDPKTLLGEAQVLMIDALDEVSTQKEGDAVDLVIKKLGELGCPRFVLSCRVADWRSATGLTAIREQYPEEPLELHLEPFDDDDATAFLSATLGDDTAKAVVDHFNALGLSDLLGNPQTLDMIASVAEKVELPETRSELFEQAIEVLRVEHKDSKANEQPAREMGLDSAGAAFAGLLLSGSEAIVRKSAANTAEGELLLADISTLLGGEVIGAMFDTRLFKAAGVDRFSYLHRRIGEYLGAQWLAKQADNKRKRRRLLSLFHSQGLVPASLRGLHAWLARDPALAREVIAADPMGVIEYGDADSLTVEQARELISALDKLAVDNPRFHNWGKYSLRGIAHPDLTEELRRLITVPETPFSLCILVLEAIKGTDIVLDLVDDLRSIVLDSQAVFACRRSAGEALAELSIVDDWQSILCTIYGDDLSVRLAIELADVIAYEQIDDDLIVDMVVTSAESDDSTIGVMIGLEHNLPLSRVVGVLELLVTRSKKLGDCYDRPGNEILTDLAYNLIIRAVDAGGVTAEKLLFWLEPFAAEVGYQREVRQQLDALIRSDDQLRHSIQRHVLLELHGDEEYWQRVWHLRERLSSLVPTDEDVVELLEGLDPTNHSDERWRDLVQLVQHDDEVGAEVREAARSFATHSTDMLEWLDELKVPQVPEWQTKQEEQNKKRRAEQAARNLANRKYYESNIEQMRRGDYGVIIDPAKAYLKLYRDIGDDVSAHERISDWLGEEIADAAHEGFETYLLLDPPIPSAQEIVEALVEEKSWDAGYIIVSALAERYRKDIGYDDLTDERLMAGLFELRRSFIDDHAGIDGLKEVIEATVQARGIWEEAMRLYHEPQLEAKRESVDGLYVLMRDDEHAELGAKLAAEWLERFPDLPIGIESELIDKLLLEERFDNLGVIATSREDVSDDKRRRNWDVVGLIVDFKQTAERLEVTPIESELFWHIRNRARSRYSNDTYIAFSPAQLEWIIRSFRLHWPMVHRRPGASGGDTNSWDASEYLVNFIRLLGNDTSEAAIVALIHLRDAPADGYLESIKVVIAEQTRIRVEAAYAPPSLGEINAITRNIAPVSAADLQTFVIEELEIAQAKIKSDDADSWRGFYDDDGVPFVEERCRDHLLGLLRQGTQEISFDPEAHVAADKEVDIACSVGTLRMPIEVKGQWHKELWKGADMQLDALYTGDWRADGRGIYLVLWFGTQKEKNKRLKSPGRGMKHPQSADELREMIIAKSKSAREGRVVVYVLDLVRA